MTSTINDFDFLFGAWRVEHRRLINRLVDSDEWEEFDGTSTVFPMLGGAGNIEDNVINLPGDTYRAAAIRSYDERVGTWSIWWLDARNPLTLDVPVVGAFVDGEGVFIARDTFEDQSIVVRFRWRDTRSGVPLWDQAFSADDGQTWELNWTMHFHRMA